MNKDKERSPFLADQRGVSLTPSWEAQQLSNDELNFKGLSKTKMQTPFKSPSDKWKIVYIIFIIHGLGTLMPWNMFITAKDYFVDFKLDTNSTTATDSTNYATNFMQYHGLAAQIPNLLFNWLNIFVNFGGDLTNRIVYSILLEIVIFIITIILAMVDSSGWPETFFWITMLSVVLLNMANGIYQNTIYGMVATLPIKYTGAVVLGANISGLFTTIISICSRYIFGSPRTSAIYYFITVILVLLICFDTYFALPLNNFYKYQTTFKRETQQLTSKEEPVDVKTPYWKIFKQAFPQLFNVFFTFFVTLSIFPALHSDIKPSSDDFIISENFFTSITCFLTFNLFAMLGSLATSWINWPKPKYLAVPVILRAFLIPVFLFCNYIPKDITRTLPIFITNDYIYWAFAILMSFSSGYLSSLGMMYAPQTVTPKYQVKAGMFAAAMLITGIFSGILFSCIFPIIVTF